MTVSVIIPTITGREPWLERCLAAYSETCPDAEVIVIENRTACGVAWQDGAEKATGDYLHFTADDLEPAPGWWQAAVEVVDRGALPGAQVFADFDTPWTRVASACPFRHGYDPPNLLVPFFSREQFEQGGWLVPIHYGSDDWVTFLAYKRQIPMEPTDAYKFLHTAAEPGRLHNNRAIDVPVLCRLMEAEWFMPDAYRQIGIELDPAFAAEQEMVA